MRRRYLPLLLLTFQLTIPLSITPLLSSCASFSDTGFFDTTWSDLDEDLDAPVADDPAGANRFQLTETEKSIYRLPYWQLSGRISIRSADDNLTGALRWRQQGDRFVIHFNAPLGQGALQVTGDAVGAKLNTADGRSMQADDLDQLFAEAAGWELPLSGLRYWIMGVPSPESKAVLQRLPMTQGPAAKISHIRQFFWDVEIRDYMQVGDRSMPRKLRLSNIEIQVRLIINTWRFHKDAAIGTEIN